eukprot:scaffold118718_cov66-Phaeocystis_antarctica.AAC.2
MHERGGAGDVWQVDARASLQQLPHHLQLIVDRGGMQQGFGYDLTVASCSRAQRVGLPPLAQPLHHLLQLAPLRRPVDLDGNWGGRAHRCSGSLGATGAVDSDGPALERAAARARCPSLGRRCCGRAAGSRAERAACNRGESFKQGASTQSLTTTTT